MFNKFVLVALLVPGSAHTASWWRSGPVVVHQDPNSSDIQTGKINVLCPYDGPGLDAGDQATDAEKFTEIVPPQIAEKERKEREKKKEEERKKQAAALAAQQLRERNLKANGLDTNGVFFGEYDSDGADASSTITSTDYGAPLCVDPVAAREWADELGKQVQLEIGQLKEWAWKVWNDEV